MKTFTMKEFELKEDEIFELAKEEGGVILTCENGKHYKLTPIDDETLTDLIRKEQNAEL